MGTDCGSDHELLIARFGLKLKKIRKTTRPFRSDLNQIPYDYSVEVRNRFKGLDLKGRVPGVLRMEVHDIVQWTRIKTIPKKMRDTKETFHSKMGTRKDRNGMDLTETEDIKKRRQENTEELYKKHLYDPDNHDGMISDLEPDLLECEVKWALGSITMNKASGGDGTPVELFQILKDDAVKVLHSMCQQIWNAQQWPQDWKRSVFIPISKKGNA